MRVLLATVLLGVGASAWAQITSLPYSTDFSVTEEETTIGDVNPFSTFDKVASTGTVTATTGTYLGENNYVLAIRNAEAKAYFDSDTETEGNQVYSLASNEKVTISFTTYQGYLVQNKTTMVRLFNSDGVELIRYDYNHTSCNITDVKLGGSTPSEFSEFKAQSTNGKGTGLAGLANYGTGDGTCNMKATFVVTDKGYVSLNLKHSVKGVDNTYSTILSGVRMNLAYISIRHNGDIDDRRYCIDNFSVTSETAYPYVLNAVDESGNILQELASGTETVGTNKTVYWKKGLKIGDTWYMADAQATTPHYGHTFTGYETYGVVYKPTDLIYYAEMDDIASGLYVQTNCADYTSNGNARFFQASKNGKISTSIGIETAGPYDVFVAAIDRSGSSQSLELYRKTTEDAETLIGTIKSSSKTYLYPNTFKNVSFAVGEELYSQPWTSTSNGTICIDYVTLAKSKVAYTVEYKCGGTTLKTADATRTAVWGTNVTLTDADKEDIIYNHATYEYASDDASSVTIASDGSSVITVEFTQVPFYTQTNVTSAETWDWTTVASGTAYDELTASTTPTNSEEFILKNVELYGKQDGSAYSVPTGFGDAQKLKVKCQYPFRYNSGGMFQGNIIKFTTTVPGTVEVHFSHTGNKTDTDDDRRYLYVNGNNTGVSTYNTTEQTTTAAVTPGEVTIDAYNSDAASPSAVMLRIYKVIFTPVTEVSATLGTYGYASFSSTYPVDFTGVDGLKAYKATACNGSTVTMEEITGAVAANTGLVLKGTANTYNIPVVASGDAVDGNLLHGCDGSWSTLGVSGDGTNYVLSVQSENVVWAPVLDGDKLPSLSAGQAYLYVPAAGSRSLTMVFDDDLTGINSVKSDATLNNGAVYNLRGQRVAQPTKGLYIMDGKKVIVK